MALTGKGAARRRERIAALERPDYGWIWKPLLVLLVVALLVAVALGIWWSRTPPPFDVEAATAEQRQDDSPAARGAVTTAALMTTLETLLEKPGGYLRNDIAPPGIWLDNMPSWELGVLKQARDLARALPAMEEGEVEALDEAAVSLANDSTDWLYPSTEHHLEAALEFLEGYLEALGMESAGFVAGAGLTSWLEQVAGRLDDLGLRLSASVGSRDRLRELGIDSEELPSHTPWYRVDNIFFEARGSGWALLHMLEAMRRDQADVLEEADASEELALLIDELRRTQRRLWSPLVLNGSGFGVFANHSLVMANHVVRSRDLARDLAERLAGPPSTLAVEEATEEVVAPSIDAVERSEDAGAEAPPEALSPPESESATEKASEQAATDSAEGERAEGETAEEALVEEEPAETEEAETEEAVGDPQDTTAE